MPRKGNNLNSSRLPRKFSSPVSRNFPNTENPQLFLDFQQTEAKFKTIFENSAVAIMFADNQERLVSWNHFTEDLLDMGPEDLKLKPICSFYPEDEWKRIRAMNIRAKRFHQHLETKMIKKSGEEIEVDISITVIKDAEGNITGSIGIIMDITEQKTAERARLASEQKLRTIFENSPVAIMFADNQERLVSWNPFTEHLLDMNGDDLKLKPICSLYPKEEWKRIRSMDIRRKKIQEHLETKMVKKNGQLIDVEISISVLKDEQQNIVGSIGIVRDITEQKLAEQERQAKEAALAVARSKTEFFANVSHEMRTPLNGMIGMMDLMKYTNPTPEQQEYLKAAQMSAETLYALINDILDFSKIEAGKLVLEHIEFNLRETVGEVMAILEARAWEKNLEFMCDISPEVPEKVMGDPNRLKQVLVNLLGNAIKFTEKGEVIVKVEAEAKSRDVMTVEFCINDTGIGIRPEKQKLLFNPFFQADSSMSRKYGGTGLGLSIAAQLVRIMEGQIRVAASSPFYRSRKHPGGPGTTFYFSIPFKVAHAHGTKPHDIDLLRGVPVVVMDDNISQGQILTGMLKRWHMKPVFFQSGAEARQYLHQVAKNGEPKNLLMLIDAEMPQDRGLKFVKWLRDESGLTNAKFIMMHALGKASGMAPFCRIGASAELIKPLKEQMILEALLNVVDPKRTHAPEHKQERLAEQRPMRILLVEDNPVNQKVMEGILKKQNHNFVIASCGQDAIDLFKDRIFDLVLMDIQMPEMDGFETTEKLRKLEKKTCRRTPIVALTAHALKEDRDRSLAAGMDGYLVKPLRPKDLYNAIQEWAAPAQEKTSPVSVPPASDKSGETPQPLVFNRSTALMYMGGDEALLEKVFGVFLEESATRIETMREALRARDIATIEWEMHALKADSRALGAEIFCAASYECELMAKRKNWDELDGKWESFEKAFADLKKCWAETPRASGGGQKERDAA